MANDLTDRRFGKLTAQKREGKTNRHIDWVCECDCGDLILVRGDLLTSGAVIDCGMCGEDRDPSGLWNPPEKVQRVFSQGYHEQHPRRVTRRVDKEEQFRQLMAEALVSEWNGG